MIEVGESFTIAGVYEADERPKWLKLLHWVIRRKPERRLREFHNVSTWRPSCYLLSQAPLAELARGTQQMPCQGCFARTSDAFTCSYCGRPRIDPEMLRNAL